MGVSTYQKDDAMKTTQTKIIDFFENLSPELSLKEYTQIYAHDVYFKDPFNETIGVEQVYAIFGDMYQTLHNPRFRVIEYIENDGVVYLKWEFLFALTSDAVEQSFTGVSRLAISEGHIKSHVDYWDAGEHVYAKIPLLGWLIGKVKKRISHAKD